MYIETSIDIVIEVESIILLHYFNYSKHFCFPGESHNFWEMLFVDNGEVSISADGVNSTISAGYAVFHKPNEFHSIWTNENFASAAVITFVSNSPAMHFFEGRIIRLTSTQKEYIALTLKEGLQAYEGPLNYIDQKKLTAAKDAVFGSSQLVKTYIELLLIDIIQNEKRLNTPSPSLLIAAEFDDEIVSAIMKILNNNVCKQITLDDICNQLPYSSSLAQKTFKARTNYSIVQMLTKLKIDKAKQLISEDIYTVTEISEILGYSTIHYFSRHFKRITGMSPSQYAKSVKTKALL